MIRRTLRRWALAATGVLIVAGCSGNDAAPGDTHNPLASWVPSTNFEPRRPVMIVLHYTQQSSADAALDTLRSRNWQGPVSAHYLVGDDGQIYQLVADLDRAWHAGEGSWGPITDVNDVSIGIEIDNDGREPYTEVQITALIRLLDDLTTRLGIAKSSVIGHSDLAPTRKVDPGAHFPWERLYRAGFGIWPTGPLVDPPDGFDPWLAMAAIGYALDDPAMAVRAFHLHFRARNDGRSPSAEFDAEDVRILYALTRGGYSSPASSTGSSNNPSGTVTRTTPSTTSSTKTTGTNAPEDSSSRS